MEFQEVEREWKDVTDCNSSKGERFILQRRLKIPAGTRGIYIVQNTVSRGSDFMLEEILRWRLG
jgi:hypothetical protein